MKTFAVCLMALLATQSVRADERVLKNEIVIRTTDLQALKKFLEAR